jgi:hypothetical protein
LAIFVRKQKGVEPIPPLDLLQTDHRTTRTIEYRVAARGKLGAPILIRLLVHVEFTALARNGGREHDEVAMPAEVVDQGVGVSFRNVFRYFEAQHELEVLSKVEGLRYVNRPESVCRDSQCIQRNVVPVHTHDLLEPDATAFRQPYAGSAAYVEYRHWRSSIESNLNDRVQEWASRSLATAHCEIEELPIVAI